jgi:8-oxo-dGTP pyrophosphatase MutT (NUDIX family)
MDAVLLRWDPPVNSCLERSDTLQSVLIQAKERGLIRGWRSENFSFWNSECDAPGPGRTPFLIAERSAFRFLGMLSQAVHINGFTPDGRMWCGRRSPGKSVDPGLLDNVTAGGLPSGETLLQCAVRELQEEAGIFDVPAGALYAGYSLRTSRMEPEGWHDEMLHVFNLNLPNDFVPANQDGEVAEFLCLTPEELLVRIRNHEFTVDAALVIAQGLLGENVPPH